MKKSNWVLRKQVDTIHLEYYDVDEVEILRRKLIEDCFKVFKQRGQTISGFTFKAVINKRFGVKE